MTIAEIQIELDQAIIKMNQAISKMNQAISEMSLAKSEEVKNDCPKSKIGHTYRKSPAIKAADIS